MFIAVWIPESFNLNFEMLSYDELSQNFIYYSFVTLTTLGYGDIIPVLDVARTLAWIEALLGQLYLTIVLAQLIGVYVSRKRNHK